MEKTALHYPLHHPGVVPGLSMLGKAGSGPPGQTPGLPSSAQSLAFHNGELKFPSQLALPEQHSLFLSPLPGLSLPVKEGQVQRSWIWCLPWEELSCSAQEKPSF